MTVHTPASAPTAAMIAGEPKAPPTAMIFGAAGQQHPHIRFIRNLLEAKIAASGSARAVAISAPFT